MDCNYTFSFNLTPDGIHFQSEQFNYNPNFVWLNQILKRFLCVYRSWFDEPNVRLHQNINQWQAYLEKKRVHNYTSHCEGCWCWFLIAETAGAGVPDWSDSLRLEEKLYLLSEKLTVLGKIGAQKMALINPSLR